MSFLMNLFKREFELSPKGLKSIDVSLHGDRFMPKTHPSGHVRQGEGARVAKEIIDELWKRSSSEEKPHVILTLPPTSRVNPAQYADFIHNFIRTGRKKKNGYGDLTLETSLLNCTQIKIILDNSGIPF